MLGPQRGITQESLLIRIDGCRPRLTAVLGNVRPNPVDEWGSRLGGQWIRVRRNIELRYEIMRLELDQDKMQWQSNASTVQRPMKERVRPFPWIGPEKKSLVQSQLVFLRTRGIPHVKSKKVEDKDICCR